MHRSLPLIVVFVFACTDSTVQNMNDELNSSDHTGSESEIDDKDSDDTDWAGPGSGRCEHGIDIPIVETETSAGIEDCLCDEYHRYESVNCGEIPEVEVIDLTVPPCACEEGELCLQGAYAPRCVRLCATDEDCPEGEACVCAFDNVTFINVYSQCVPANCRTDADCAPYRCGLVPEGCNYELEALRCHTAADTCGNSCQCPPKQLEQRCAPNLSYLEEERPWECLDVSLCD